MVETGGAAQPVVLTLHVLNELPLIAGIGGKAGCQKMRELRQTALADKQHTVDLSYGDWPWKQILRPASLQNRTIIVGPGITAFTFRVLLLPILLRPTSLGSTVLLSLSPDGLPQRLSGSRRCFSACRRI